jgi:hypothetical protein
MGVEALIHQGAIPKTYSLLFRGIATPGNEMHRRQVDRLISLHSLGYGARSPGPKLYRAAYPRKTLLEAHTAATGERRPSFCAFDAAQAALPRPVAPNV